MTYYRWHRQTVASVRDRAEKRCPRCEQTLPVSAFAVDQSQADGRAPYCRPCKRAYWLEWSRESGDWRINASRQRARERKRAQRQSLLTDRQRQVMYWLAQGWTFEEIGEELGISRHAAASHYVWAAKRLNASNKHHATALYVVWELGQQRGSSE